MLEFEYEARDAAGVKVKGQLTAESPANVVAELDRRGLRTFHVARRNGAFAERVRNGLNGRLSRAGLVRLTRHLSAFTNGGVPLARGLESLGREEAANGTGAMAQKLGREIAAGRSLSQALALHPKAFKPFYVGAIEAGERAGRLAPVLETLLAHLMREEELAEETQSAARYPAFVLLYCSVAFMGIFSFAIPALATFYQRLGTRPPAFTEWLIQFHSFVVNDWDVVVWGLVLVALGIAYAWQAAPVRVLAGRALLGAPFLSRYSGKPEVARFAKLFSVLVKSGLPVPDALEHAARSIENPALAEDAKRVRTRLVGGGRLADVLRGARHLPPTLAEAATGAEIGGDLGRGLDALADRLDLEVRHDLKRFGTSVGPILLGIAGVIVIFLLLAVDVPMIERARMTSGFTSVGR